MATVICICQFSTATMVMVSRKRDNGCSSKNRKVWIIHVREKAVPTSQASRRPLEYLKATQCDSHVAASSYIILKEALSLYAVL